MCVIQNEDFLKIVHQINVYMDKEKRKREISYLGDWYLEYIVFKNVFRKTHLRRLSMKRRKLYILH